jgi:uncharacterized protein (TIGR00369 family)
MLTRRPGVQYLVDLPAASRDAMQQFFHHIPYQKRLRMSIADYGFARARVRLPFAPELVGDPEQGFLHGGAVTALVDSAAGLAMLLALPAAQRIATLDLRIDYMRPALAQDTLCDAECFRLTRQVGFVRSVVFQDRHDDPIACGIATFMRVAEEPVPRPEGEAR